MKRVFAILGLILIACAFAVLLYGALTHNTAYLMSAIVVLFMGPIIVYGMIMVAKMIRKVSDQSETD